MPVKVKKVVRKLGDTAISGDGNEHILRRLIKDVSEGLLGEILAQSEDIIRRLIAGTYSVKDVRETALKYLEELEAAESEDAGDIVSTILLKQILELL